MIISHTHKFIFIKSWKTAGTSIEAALSEHSSGDDIVTPLGDYGFNRDEKGEWVHKSMNAGDFNQHDDALTIKRQIPPEVWADYFKFSIARNPWDRMISLFYWENRRTPPPLVKKRFYHHLGVPFDELRDVRKSFAEFVKKGEWETNDRFYVIDNQLCADFVIRYENLADGLSEVCKTVGIPITGLPQLKSGMREKSHHYSEYYDEETKNIVAERHMNDIQLLGYRFKSA
jgi:hypothetical protein